jgi:hypothetical protein
MAGLAPPLPVMLQLSTHGSSWPRRPRSSTERMGVARKRRERKVGICILRLDVVFVVMVIGL